MKILSVLFAVTLCSWLVTCVPTQDKKDRIHHGKDLSDHKHDDSTDFQYDHEAFLGKEEAKTFDQLTPEESKERLGKLSTIIRAMESNLEQLAEEEQEVRSSDKEKKHLEGKLKEKIVDKIDRDKDGFITNHELKDWIGHSQNRYIYENVNKHWRDYDKNKDDKISWEEYKNTTYGYAADEEPFYDVPDKERYRNMMKRDERRFKQADKDGDLIATRDEFTAFLHPEEFDYMKDIVITETIEDIDKNGDMLVDVNEYIADMYTPENDEPEPEWVKSERHQFAEHRDLNKDGKLDRSEIGHWIHPHEYDHKELEAKHLIYESDKDRDEKLTKKEILDNWNMFVGSQATNYGEDLTRRHDEF